jgi:gamma-glutamyl:cysteine ligase YbdK (ATP-grasp superfamily)
VSRTYGLFEAHGVEIEYAIVDAETLRVLPIAEKVLEVDGEVFSDVVDGEITWSNELARHVIELKTTDPAVQLEPYFSHFARSVGEVLGKLHLHGATLLPGGVHPFMDPTSEFQRWEDEGSEVYAAFDRIFDCRGHGWANLQSTHLNLPFSGDDELGRLHAAVRLVLPILPALTASSPFLDGRRAPNKDQRLAVYRTNAARLPEITGAVIPEPVFDEASYRASVFEPMYRAVAPFDPDGVLQHEWLNARGAIVRFDRSTIEIRVMDCQEHSGADLAVCLGVTSVVRAMVEERFAAVGVQKAQPSEPLAAIFSRSVEQAEDALVEDPGYLSALGLSTPARARDVWIYLFERAGALGSPFSRPLAHILEHGTLATRLVAAVGEDAPPMGKMVEVYGRLARCLREGCMFMGKSDG